MMCVCVYDEVDGDGFIFKEIIFVDSYFNQIFKFAS